VRWLIIVALASCHAGRDGASSSIEAYQHLVAKACSCRDAACASSTSWEWPTEGSHEHGSEAAETWRLELAREFDHCLRRARGESTRSSNTDEPRSR
jgi:hypothetical protein